MKKLLCGSLALAMAIATGTGCSNVKNGRNEEGKIVISIDSWPTKDKNPETWEKKEAERTKFMEMYPDIEVVGDTYGYHVSTFTQKAAADQLPTVFYMPFTEAKKGYSTGYMKDVTSLLEKYKYLENYTDQVKSLIKSPDDKYYCIAESSYVFGLLCNAEMFEKAGYGNGDGTIKFPETFDELAEAASKIKKATGNAGFVMPTRDNCGGWHFMNIARGFGVVFMEQDKDGKWHAKFDDENGVLALKYVYDLKWKYDALANNALIDIPEMNKMLATGQAASMFASGVEATTGKTLCITNGMDKDLLTLGPTPAGPKGRFALMGGSLRAIPHNATDEQADAGFKWLQFQGISPDITEEAIQSLENTYSTYAAEGVPFTAKGPYSVWKSGNNVEETTRIRSKYSNLDPNKFNEYYDRMDEVTVVPEEEYYCQELYALLDSCIQEVLTNKDADIQQLLTDAAQNFQVNYLDKM